MRLILLISFLLPLVNAQGQFNYYLQQDKSEKHFIGISYGMGNNFWHSRTENYALYDQQGLIIVDGDAEFKANNVSQKLQVETLVPVSQKLKLGIGIAFEEYSLYRLDVEGIDHSIPFVEIFRFDKIFAQGELPINILKSAAISLNLNMRTGYYGFFSVRSPSLFGEAKLGKTYFGSLGLLTDIRISEEVYLYLLPHIEYKYFNNQRLEHPSMIFHHLWSYNLSLGVRVNIE